MKAINPICLGVVHALIGKFRMGNGKFLLIILAILFITDFFYIYVKIQILLREHCPHHPVL